MEVEERAAPRTRPSTNAHGRRLSGEATMLKDSNATRGMALRSAPPVVFWALEVMLRSKS